MDTNVVLPLGPLDDDLALWNSGELDTEVSGSYNCVNNPTPDILLCPGVGLLPLVGEADGQALKYDLHLCAQQDFDRDNERGKLAPML